MLDKSYTVASKITGNKGTQLGTLTRSPINRSSTKPPNSSIRMSLPFFFFKIDQFIKLYTTIIWVTIGKILLHLSINHASEHDK